MLAKRHDDGDQLVFFGMLSLSRFTTGNKGRVWLPASACTTGAAGRSPLHVVDGPSAIKVTLFGSLHRVFSAPWRFGPVW
jgi:hypothetical protein